MLVRLTPSYGGDGTVHGIIAMNEDLALLGDMTWLAIADCCHLCERYDHFLTIHVQVRLVRDDNTPWGNWIDEVALVKQPALNLLRLSGVGIRRHCI